MSEYEFNKFVKEEADIRKRKAKKILLYHSIGSGAIGVVPGVDLAVQKCVIQKNATKKIGQIFGLDINLISKEEDSFNIKNANNENNFEIIKGEKYAKTGQYSSSGIAIGTASILGDSVNIISRFGLITGEITLTALRAVSISFIFIGSAIGIGTGYYFTKRHCEELIDKLYKYFLEHIGTLSDSLLQAVQYLESRAKYFKN